MTPRMSVFLTQQQVRDGTKTVTRRHRDTWTQLRPGDRLLLIEKGQGLPRGAKQVVIREVEITDVRVEPIRFATDEDVRREGLWGQAVAACDGIPGATPVEWFVSFWLSSHSYKGTVAESVTVECRRIEWRYLG